MASIFGDFFKTLFGGGGGESSEAPAGNPVEYQGYIIRPAPRQDGGRWLTAGIVTKTFDDGDKEHRFTRAETHGGHEEATSFSITKGKQIVDDLGDRMFLKDS
ncbi:MAG: HlyU family transcriptional regulator [Alphaproteobacteria bacterium]